MKSIFDYKQSIFDFEVLPNWFCVSFINYDSKTQTKENTYTFASTLDSGIENEKELDRLFDFLKFIIPDYILVAWNVNYDKYILYHLWQFYLNGKSIKENEKRELYFKFEIWDLLFQKSNQFIIDQRKKNKDDDDEKNDSNDNDIQDEIEETLEELEQSSENMSEEEYEKKLMDSFINFFTYEQEEVVKKPKEDEFINWNKVLDKKFLFENPILFYDAMKYITIPKSLKVAASESGFSILESSIKFDTVLSTIEEINELIKYNIHDVEILLRQFIKYYDYYDIRAGLVDEFTPKNLNYIEFKNNAFYHKILEVSKNERLNLYNDEKNPDPINDKENLYFFEIIKRPEYQKINDVISKMLEDDLHPAIKYVIDYIRQNPIKVLSKEKYEIPLNKDTMLLFDLEDSVVAVGGVHGSSNVILKTPSWGTDVASYYPFLMIIYNLLSRAIPENKRDWLQQMIDKRLLFKSSSDPQLKKKDKPYKVLINALYGAMRAVFSNLYDPINGTILVILGQLLLLWLMNMISPYVKSFVNLNTDGVFFKPKDNVDDKIQNKINEWMRITGFGTENEYATQVFNFDVNNYVYETYNKEKDKKSIKVKGKYLNQYFNFIHKDENKPLSVEMINSYQIVSLMIVNLLLYNKPFKDTINENQELWRYMNTIKSGNKFDGLVEVYKEEIDLSNQFKDLNVNNPIIELVKFNPLKENVVRLFAIKEGKLYKKYKEIKLFKENVPYFKNSSKINPEEYTPIKIDDYNIYALKPNKITKKNPIQSYKLLFKSYEGDKIGDAPNSAYIYNKPLFHNYEDKLFYTKEDIKSISDFKKETNQEIDLNFYIQYAKDYMITKIVKKTGDIRTIIPRFDELTQLFES